MASKMVDLPEPVGPATTNRPCDASAEKSMVSARGNEPNAWNESRIGLMRRPPRLRQR
jgi:hypothetical protein